MIGSLRRVLNKITYYFTEVFECCWTYLLQMLRGTEQRQLKTDLVSLQFYFITVLNSHSTSIRHHRLVIERINSLIKTRLATLCFASHPSSFQLLTTKTTPRQLDVQNLCWPCPGPERRCRLECWRWQGCHRVYLTHISLSLLQTRNAGNENLFSLWEPQP